MSYELKKCPECSEIFRWDDEVVRVEDEDEIYHEKCLQIFASGYFAMDKLGNAVGEVEDVGMEPSDYLDYGEYIDYESEAE